MTALLAVWGNRGATVVRWERGVTPTVTSMGLGTTLPLLNSAAGRVFLTWAPAAPLRTVREVELRRIARSASLQPDLKPSQAAIDAMIEEIRARGFASVDGRNIPGLVAAAAPILDWQGEAHAAVTLVGADPATVTPDAPEIALLREFCAAMSVTRAPLI